MNVNFERTKQYYKELKEEELCTCDYCKNYYLHIKSTYPELSVYLQQLGVDIEKPFELCSFDLENGYIDYAISQYVVFGTCPKDYHHQIGTVTIELGTSYPSTRIEEEHFVLDLYSIELEWSF